MGRSGKPCGVGGCGANADTPGADTAGADAIGGCNNAETGAPADAAGCTIARCDPLEDAAVVADFGDVAAGVATPVGGAGLFAAAAAAAGLEAAPAAGGTPIGREPTAGTVVEDIALGLAAPVGATFGAAAGTGAGRDATEAALKTGGTGDLALPEAADVLIASDAAAGITVGLCVAADVRVGAAGTAEATALRGSETSRRTSGSISSAEARRVGTNEELEGAGCPALSGAEDESDFGDSAGVDGSRSSKAPCESRSSVSIGTDDALAGDCTDAGGDALAWVGGKASPSRLRGSSTGKSVKGSKTGREAASIVFEPISITVNPGGYPAMSAQRDLGDGSQIVGPAPGL